MYTPPKRYRAPTNRACSGGRTAQVNDSSIRAGLKKPSHVTKSAATAMTPKYTRSHHLISVTAAGSFAPGAVSGNEDRRGPAAGDGQPAQRLPGGEQPRQHLGRRGPGRWAHHEPALRVVLGDGPPVGHRHAELGQPPHHLGS